MAEGGGTCVASSSLTPRPKTEIEHAARCGVPVFTTDRPDIALQIRARWRD